jgi:hypothetical protein
MTLTRKGSMYIRKQFDSDADAPNRESIWTPRFILVPHWNWLSPWCHCRIGCRMGYRQRRIRHANIKYVLSVSLKQVSLKSFLKFKSAQHAERTK